MSIKHNSPTKSLRVGELRQTVIAQGLQWKENRFQTRPQDLPLINGRVSKLNALIALGLATLDDTEITASDGTVSPLTWRSEANENVKFTVREFLQFAITVDEFIESRYRESW